MRLVSALCVLATSLPRLAAAPVVEKGSSPTPSPLTPSASSLGSSASEEEPVELEAVPLGAEEAGPLGPAYEVQCPPTDEDVECEEGLDDQCRANADCDGRDGFVCCSNGCNNACMPKVSPPPLIDWAETPLEETPDYFVVDEGADLEPATICTFSRRGTDQVEFKCPVGFRCVASINHLPESVHYGFCSRF